MKKQFLITTVALCTFGFVTIYALKIESTQTKNQKIEALFELVMPKEKIANVFDPIFANAQIADEKFKAQVNDTFYNNAKKETTSFFNTEFNDQDIDIIAQFFNSETGRHFLNSGDGQNAAMMKAMQSVMGLIQEHMTAQVKAAHGADNSLVINFNELAQGKTDAEIREAFNMLIQHDGITVVKCSSLMCEPCKIYAPTFEEIAQEIQELTCGDQKIAVKYVALDINVALTITQDHGIKSVPSTLFFKNGKKIDAKIGVLPKPILKSRIQELA